MNIIFLGPAGSGKSTQAQLLSQALGISAVSAGDISYYASLGNDEEAKIIKETMQKGELLPTSIMLKLVEEHISGPEHSKGAILDGFPRILDQAQSFSWPIDKVIYINVPDDEVTKRLTVRGRQDDTPEVIKRRLEIYHNDTEPVLEYYKNKGLLVEIDGLGDVDSVFESIRKTYNND